MDDSSQVDDLSVAAHFFGSRLRGVSDVNAVKLRKWAWLKLRDDAVGVAELMLAEGYRPLFLRYFIRYHYRAEPNDATGAVAIVRADISTTAAKLRQPYRDLAAVCLKFGYVHSPTIRELAKMMRDRNERS